MNESNKYGETESSAVYKQSSDSWELVMIFNKKIKTVDISMSEFIRNDTPMLEPMENDWIRHSATYGHWQMVSPTLGVEDVEFLYKKTKELFGR